MLNKTNSAMLLLPKHSVWRIDSCWTQRNAALFFLLLLKTNNTVLFRHMRSLCGTYNSTRLPAMYIHGHWLNAAKWLQLVVNVRADRINVYARVYRVRFPCGDLDGRKPMFLCIKRKFAARVSLLYYICFALSILVKSVAARGNRVWCQYIYDRVTKTVRWPKT